MSKSEVGQWGEIHAARYLRSKKYEVLGANFRTRFGELDIIARRKEYIIFVEVKTRTEGAIAPAMEAVDAEKQRKLSLAALQYLKGSGLDDQPCRFDVIEVYLARQDLKTPVRINHIPNAFDGE